MKFLSFGPLFLADALGLKDSEEELDHTPPKPCPVKRRKGVLVPTAVKPPAGQKSAFTKPAMKKVCGKCCIIFII